MLQASCCAVDAVALLLLHAYCYSCCCCCCVFVYIQSWYQTLIDGWSAPLKHTLASSAIQPTTVQTLYNINSFEYLAVLSGSSLFRRLVARYSNRSLDVRGQFDGTSVIVIYNLEPLPHDDSTHFLSLVWNDYNASNLTLEF